MTRLRRIIAATGCGPTSLLLVLLAVVSGMSAVAWAQSQGVAPVPLPAPAAGTLDGWTGIVAVLTGGGVGGSIAMRLLRTVDRLLSHVDKLLAQAARLLTLLEELWQAHTAGTLKLPPVVVEVHADKEVRALARMVMNAPEVELEPDDGPPTQPETGRSARR